MTDDANREPKRTRDAERTRAALLDAAEEVFAEHGARGTSIRKVGERAGVTHGTLYLYFRDKDDLLHQLAEQHFRGLLIGLRALPRTLDPVTRIRETFRAVVAYGLDAPDHYYLILSMRPPHLARGDVRALGPLAEEAYGFLFDTVAHAANRNLIGDDDVGRDAWGLLAAAHGVIELHHAGVIERAEALAYAERLIDVLVRGLTRSVKP